MNRPCPITADRDAWRGAVTEREAALVEALEDAKWALEDAKWALEGIVEDEIGDDIKACPRFPGEDLCGASSCEVSGCAVERLARVNHALARAHTATDAGGE